MKPLNTCYMYVTISFKLHNYTRREFPLSAFREKKNDFPFSKAIKLFLTSLTKYHHKLLALH